MSTLINESKKAVSAVPEYFFVYGTLRDDDDSGATYTHGWHEGFDIAMHGRLKGARMYQERDKRYPFALLSQDDKDVMYGRLIRWHDAADRIERLAEADRIEGYYPDNPHASLYHRAVVSVDVIVKTTPENKEGRKGEVLEGTVAKVQERKACKFIKSVQAYMYHRLATNHSTSSSTAPASASSGKTAPPYWIKTGDWLERDRTHESTQDPWANGDGDVVSDGKA